MTKPNESLPKDSQHSPAPLSENAMQQLYQGRRQSRQAPKRLRLRVLKAARQAEAPQENSWRSWWNQVVTVSTMAAMALFVGLGIVEQWSPQPLLLATQIEVHRLQDEPQINLPNYNERFRQVKAKYYAHYLQRHQAIMHSQQQAVLLASTGDWQLETCGQGYIAVSQGIIANLKQQQRISDGVALGSRVNIQFDAEGHILAITDSDNPHNMC